MSVLSRGRRTSMAPVLAALVAVACSDGPLAPGWNPLPEELPDGTARVQAGAPVQCTIQPFAHNILTTRAVQGPRVASLEYAATGQTVLQCPGASVITIDVWEHALLDPKRTEGDELTLELSGRGEVRIDFPNSRAMFQGHVDGTAVCNAGLCTLDFMVRANGPRGSRLLLHERGVFNRVTGKQESAVIVDGLLWVGLD